MAAARSYVDTFLCARPGQGEPETDPDTGVVYPPAPEVVWQGKGKIKTTAPAISNPEAGGAVFTVQTMQLHIPTTAGPFSIGDTFECVASPLDPQRVGQKVRVIGLHEASTATAQRLKVEQITG